MPDNLYNSNIHQLNLPLYRCLYLLHNPIGFLYILSFFLCRNRLDDSAKVVKAPKTKNGVKDKAANENLLPSTKSLNNKMNMHNDYHTTDYHHCCSRARHHDNTLSAIYHFLRRQCPRVCKISGTSSTQCSNWASCHLFFKRFNRRSKSLHTGTYRTGVHFHST